MHSICWSLMKLGNCHTTWQTLIPRWQVMHLLPYIVSCMRVKTRSWAMAASYSSIRLIGRSDFFQVSLPKLVKFHFQKAEKLYGRAQKWWAQIVVVRNTGPCRCSRSSYVLSQTKSILLKWISVVHTYLGLPSLRNDLGAHKPGYIQIGAHLQT